MHWFVKVEAQNEENRVDIRQYYNFILDDLMEEIQAKSTEIHESI